ncbi:MAG: ABC transporter permease, partial [Pyrinomonadaceae bacterium]
MKSFWQDVRYGARALWKSPGFTLVAALSIALGIGANAAISSLVNATLLRRLPVAEPERLAFVFSGTQGGLYSTTSYPDYVDFRDRSEVFEGLAARGGISASLGAGDGADLVAGSIVSGNYFEVLGVPAARGRVLTPEDDRTPGAHPVVVLSHGFWQRRFGGAEVVGREVNLNGQSFTVVGVLPAEYTGVDLGRADDIYVPMSMQAVMRPPRGGYSGEMNPDLLKVRGNRWLWMVGRLKPNVEPEQAQAAVAVVSKQLDQSYPDTNTDRTVTLTRAGEGDPQSRASLVSVARLLLSVVGIVLLIACANVANLLLARASGRRREMALRLALGASRWRIVRQLLTESVLLALLGGAAGLMLALWAIDLMKAAPPPPGALPIAPVFTVDVRVLGFTLALSALTGVLFGLAPALQASRPDLVPALKDETVSLDRGRRFSLRGLLVVAQVALSLVLLVGAGLFLRSVRHARAIDPGFDAERLLVAQLNINLLRYTRAQGREFYRQVVERVGSLPGVESVSLTRNVALTGGASTRGLLIEGQTGDGNDLRSDGAGASSPSSNNTVGVNVIGLNYFKTFGVPVVRGRDFGASDAEEGPGVVVVNEAFAARHFAGQDPLGKRLSFNGARGPWREIVGVARDSKYYTLGEARTPFVYLPLAQNHETGMALVVRAGGEPAALAASVRREVQSIEKNLPLTDARPMTEVLGAALYAARTGAALVTGFGLLALVLAAVGLYGVMAYTVARRTREVGIRMALGAQRRDVLRLVLREALALVACGVALGLAGAWAASRLLAGFLYGVSTTDPLTFLGTTAVLVAAALLAVLVPARRATKVDPMVALR